MKTYLSWRIAGLALLSVPGFAAFAMADESGPFTDLVDRGDNFFTSPWLGELFINEAQNGWVWHAQHGYLYLAPEASNEAVYLYDPVIPAWLATGRSYYPFLYVFDEPGYWVYFLTGEKGLGNYSRQFYNFATMDRLYLPPHVLPNLVDSAVQAGNFSTLAAALTAGTLLDDLSLPGPFTVFAPTDQAFAALGQTVIDDLLLPENKDRLVEILLYHVVPGAIFSPQVMEGHLTTLNGADFLVNSSGGLLYINEAQITATDLGASNGVIHVIDTVLLPPGDIPTVATQAGSFTTLMAALGAAGLTETLAGEGPFTVFAPTDEAFAKLGQATIDDLLKPENKDQLVKILTYHVVSGKVYSTTLSSGPVDTLADTAITVAVDLETGVTLNESSKVVQADIITANGVIHVIDTVLLPPSS